MTTVHGGRTRPGSASIRSFVVGMIAALATPRTIRGHGLVELTNPTAIDWDRRPVARSASSHRAHHARRAAWLTLRLLARLRPGRWRTTCLYRSVADCLALRTLGVPCHVELSAGRHPSTGEIEAHAVLRADGADVDGGDGDPEFRTPLRPVRMSARMSTRMSTRGAG